MTTKADKILKPIVAIGLLIFSGFMIYDFVSSADSVQADESGMLGIGQIIELPFFILALWALFKLGSAFVDFIGRKK